MRRNIFGKMGWALAFTVLLTLPACAPKSQEAGDIAEDAAGKTAAAREYGRGPVLMPPGGRLIGNKFEYAGGPGGQAASLVYGAYTAADREVSQNTLSISGGLITDSAYAAYGEGLARDNVLSITGGKVLDRAEAGHGRAGSTNNTAYLHGGTVNSLYGGYSTDGPADNNFLQITGGRVTGDAQAGLSLNGSASGNTARIDGGIIEDQVYGGYGMGGPATGNTTIVTGRAVVRSDVQGAVSSISQATHNTVILRGSPQLGRSVYGAFAVGEYNDEPDDTTGNKIILEGFQADLGDLWNAETVRIDGASRLGNREQALSFHNCRQVVNDGVIALREAGQAYFNGAEYLGSGRFELEPGAYINMRGGRLSSPLRIELAGRGTLQPFTGRLVVELSGVALGQGLKADQAVRLVNENLGSLRLTLERVDQGSTINWYVSGK